MFALVLPFVMAAPPLPTSARPRVLAVRESPSRPLQQQPAGIAPPTATHKFAIMAATAQQQMDDASAESRSTFIYTPPSRSGSTAAPNSALPTSSAHRLHPSTAAAVAHKMYPTNSPSPSHSVTLSPVRDAAAQPSPSSGAFEAVKRELNAKVVLLAHSVEAHAKTKQELLDLRAQYAAEQTRRIHADALVSTLRREKMELSNLLSTSRQKLEEANRAARTRPITRADGKSSSPTAGATPTKGDFYSDSSRTKFSRTLSDLIGKIKSTPGVPEQRRTSSTGGESTTNTSATIHPKLARLTSIFTSRPSGPSSSPPIAPRASSPVDVDREELKQLRFLTQHFHTVLSDTEEQVLDLQESLASQQSANASLRKELLLSAHMQEQVSSLAKTLHAHQRQIAYEKQLNADLEEALEKQDATTEALMEEQAALRRAVDTLSGERDNACASANKERQQRQRQDDTIHNLKQKVSSLRAQLLSAHSSPMEHAAHRHEDVTSTAVAVDSSDTVADAVLAAWSGVSPPSQTTTVRSGVSDASAPPPLHIATTSPNFLSPKSGGTAAPPSRSPRSREQSNPSPMTATYISSPSTRQSLSISDLLSCASPGGRPAVTGASVPAPPAERQLLSPAQLSKDRTLAVDVSRLREMTSPTGATRTRRAVSLTSPTPLAARLEQLIASAHNTSTTTTSPTATEAQKKVDYRRTHMAGTTQSVHEPAPSPPSGAMFQSPVPA